MSAQPEALFDEALRPLVIPLPAPIARATDPSPSHEAAALVQGSRAASEDWVVGALSELGPSTDEQVYALAQRQNVRWSASRLRTARKEAVDHQRVAAHDVVQRPSGRRTSLTRWAVTG